MKKYISIAILLFSVSFQTYSQSYKHRYNTKSLLKQLDLAIEIKDLYHDQREDRIEELKIMAQKEKPERLYTIYQNLYSEYSSYQSDSALSYLRRIEALPCYKQDSSIRIWTNISFAKSYAVMGIYNTAIDLLDDIDITQESTDLQLYYAQVARAIYGWLGDYITDENGKRECAQKVSSYREEILKLETNTINRNIVLVDEINMRAKELLETDPKLADSLLNEAGKISLLDWEKADISQKIYIHSNLAETHRLRGDDDGYIYYMTQTAIGDIQKGVTEYMSLPMLALALYENKEIDRAYRYLICSMEDATFCKARLRTIEASSFFPIIDRTYKEQEKEQHFIEKALFYSLGLFAIIVTFILFILYRQMKKLRTTRKELARNIIELQHTGKQLQLANKDLIMADKTKEEYIARYLARCRGSLDTLDEYRRSLYRLAKDKRSDELFKQLKSETLVREEQDKFFADFDQAFLHLYPRFIEKFNALLDSNSQIQPKQNELLSPELRIFALIRLGINDSARIAHFLNYSLTTIYNYRSKIKGKAIVPKEEFEKRIMEL